jgi:DNA polymerase III sliding clamp (beta) subunit (PCNA family)
VFDRQELIAALSRIALFSVDDAKRVIISVSEGMTARLSGISNLAGNAEEEVLLLESEGGAIETAFDYRYWTQALQSFATKTVRMKLSHPLRPALLEPVDDESGVKQIHVVMPMHLVGGTR